MKNLRQRWVRVFAAAGLLAVAGAGCQTAQSQRRDFARTPLGAVERDEAVAAAEAAMRSHFGRVTTDAELGRLTAEPAYFEEAERGGDAQIMRRRAIMELVRQESGYWAYVQVAVERSSQSVYRMFGGERADRDFESPTPMESGETAPASQRHVWRQVRRDFALERELLAEIRERLGLEPLAGSVGPVEAGAGAAAQP